MALIVGQGRQETGPQRGPQIFLSHAQGVCHTQGRVLLVQLVYPLQVRQADQGIADGLLHPHRNQGISHSFLELNQRPGLVVGNGGGKHGGRNVIVANNPHHLLHQVFFDINVVSPVGYQDIQASGTLSFGLKSQGLQHSFHPGEVQLHAQNLPQPLEGERNGQRGFVPLGVNVHNAPRHLPAGQVMD